MFKIILNTSQVTFIYIVLYTIQIVSKQLYGVKLENNVLVIQKKINFVVKQLCKRIIVNSQGGSRDPSTAMQA